MDENQDAKSVNAINYPEDEDLDNNNSFDIAGVNLKNWESKPRSAAQPQFRKDIGFQ